MRLDTIMYIPVDCRPHESTLLCVLIFNALLRTFKTLETLVHPIIRVRIQLGNTEACFDIVRGVAVEVRKVHAPELYPTVHFRDPVPLEVLPELVIPAATRLLLEQCFGCVVFFLIG